MWADETQTAGEGPARRQHLQWSQFTEDEARNSISYTELYTAPLKG